MSAFLSAVDAWVTAALLAVAMIAGWAIGWWRGQSLGKEEREAPANKFHDAILAVLGLLLAFTFSMSLVKHEQRRQMVVTDSNAIGDFYTSVSLRKEPVRGKLQAVVRRYVEHQLSVAQSTADEAALQRNLDEIQEMRQALGVAVFSGMLGVTAFGIFLTPVFYYVIRRLDERHAPAAEAGASTGTSIQQ